MGKNKLSKEEKYYTQLNNRVMVEVNKFNRERYGISTARGYIHLGNELMYMFEANKSREECMKFYKTHKCWPEKIPPSLLISVIVGYYNEPNNEIYNLFFIDNDTRMPKSLFLAGMNITEIYNSGVELSWLNHQSVKNMDEMPEYVNPENYLPIIMDDIDNYRIIRE